MHTAKQKKNKLQQLKVIMKSVGYSIQSQLKEVGSALMFRD